MDIAAFDETGELRGRVLTPQRQAGHACPGDSVRRRPLGSFTTRSDSNGKFTVRGIPASTDVRLTADSFRPPADMR